jgi:hypothetical protein
MTTMSNIIQTFASQYPDIKGTTVAVRFETDA